MTQEEKALAAMAAFQRASRRWSEARQELRHDKTCTHSKTEMYTWEHDDGYGRQSLRQGRRCVACGAVDRWGGSSFHQE